MGQISEELEHKVGMVETSLSRTGMILDSIQGDVMQIKKGMKEVVLEIESIRQKLIFHDDSLQLVNKGQEYIKSVIDEGFKSMSHQIAHDTHHENIQEITSMLSALPHKFESCVHKIQSDLCKALMKEIQVMASSLKVPSDKLASPTSHPPLGITYCSASRDLKNAPVHSKIQLALVPKNEMEGWKSVKREQVSMKDKKSNKRPNQKGVSPIQRETGNRVIIESDEDTDEGFSCLLNEKDKSAYLGKKPEMRSYSAVIAKEESERILRKARREKRKCRNPIIIN